MLVLTRKKNQSIVINDNIEITVLEIDGEQIKLGIQAPKSVDIHRKEVYLAIQEENSQAVENTPSTLKGLTELFKKQ
ncbi:carbon storage regulator CsrA [Peribacillus tepidiphilus]|jgi:carbon storage regulator|uniref:carbon storage regulator CsrA n=1 Tax=Peribacillus tepidiphilus TaxID=2652445 RepID=UPI0035B56765